MSLDPRPRLRSRALALSLLAALPVVGMAACGDDSPTGPGTTTTPAGLSTVASRYLDSALTLMQAFSINQSIAWPAFRQRTRARAGNAQTTRETYPAIQSALDELDPHSSLYPPENRPGTTDAPADRPDLRVQPRLVVPRIGYVWVPGFVGRNQLGRVDSTHAALRELEASDVCGWIVDLRAHSGGFFFALMASVGPLYATSDPYVGGQRYVGNYQELWYYRQRGAVDVFGISNRRDSVEMTITNPWRPKRPGLPVAVLQSTARNAEGQLTSITASAGESITLAFRGGPPTRSFGMPTYGVASGRANFILPDSARIDITDSYMFDRRGYVPGDNPIPPDTTIASPSPLRIGNAADPVIAAATAWLQARPECTGQGASADREPSAALGPLVQPTAPPDGRPRRLPTPQSVYDRRTPPGG